MSVRDWWPVYQFLLAGGRLVERSERKPRGTATHCPAGHPREGNSTMNARGSVYCRICHRERQRELMRMRRMA